MSKDFFGRECNVGDKVVFNEPYYKGLTSGEIVKFTPKGVKIKYHLHYGGREKESFVYDGDFVKAEVVDD